MHDAAWLLMHPVWGLGFFIVVNRFVHAEKSWLKELGKPRLVAAFAAIGVFSYSLYLTHELVIMQSWWFVIEGLPPMINTLLLHARTIGFAWLFSVCENVYDKTVPSSRFESEFLAGSVPSLSSGFPA